MPSPVLLPVSDQPGSANLLAFVPPGSGGGLSEAVTITDADTGVVLALTGAGAAKVEVQSPLPLPAGAATESTLNAVAIAAGATVTSLGGDGGTPPAVGTGVRGWLRTISEAMTSLLNALNPYRGTTTVSGGVSGTVTVPSGARVVSISCHSVTGGTVTIFGVSVPVPVANGFSTGWDGLVGGASTSIVFAGTDSYYVALNQ